MNTIKAWHFLSDDRRMQFGERELVEVGKTYRAEGPIQMCANGMHGSRRIIDALQYAPGAMICRVGLWGEVEEGNDKLVARNRKVLSMIDGTKILHEFACRCAEDALKAANVKDKRSWNAIKVKRAWLEGKATDDKLAAARDAARDAAWDAARDAAEAAAWDAARAAARAAAWDAARDAAWDAARDAQNEMLERMVVEAL